MDRNHISSGEKVGYALGDTASNFFFQTFNILLMFYYTDVFGLNPAWAGAMMFWARMWDAVSDPLMGALADRTTTRWGRYRPYLLWMAVPYGVIGYAIFANPQLATMHQKELYAAVVYLLMMTVYTAINIPYSALMGVMSRSSDERATLSSFRFVGAFTGSLLISVAVIPFKDFLGGIASPHWVGFANGEWGIKMVSHGLQGAQLVAANAQGFRYTMAIFAVLSVMCFLITFVTTRERITEPPAGWGSIGRDIGILARNKPWLIMWIAAIFTLTNVAVRNGAILYYFKYYVGREDAVTWFFLTGGVAMLVGAAFTKVLMRFWTKKELMIGLSFLNALGILAFFAIPPEHVVLMNVVNAVATLFAGPTPALVWAMYCDTADYSEWRFGRRATGLTFSSATFAQKMGLGIGAWIAGVVLTYFGYVANAIQTPHALLGIRLVMGVVPAIFAFGNVVVMFFYPLGDDTVRQIEKDLKERNAASGTGVATPA